MSEFFENPIVRVLWFLFSIISVYVFSSIIFSFLDGFLSGKLQNKGLWDSVAKSGPTVIAGIFGVYETATQATIQLRRSDTDVLKYFDERFENFLQFQEHTWKPFALFSKYFSFRKFNDTDILEEDIRVFQREMVRSIRLLRKNSTILQHVSSPEFEVPTIKYLREFYEQFAERSGVIKYSGPNWLANDVKSLGLFVRFSKFITYSLKKIRVINFPDKRYGSNEVDHSKFIKLCSLNQNDLLCYGWSICTLPIILNDGVELTLDKPIRVGRKDFYNVKAIYLNVGAAYISHIIDSTRSLSSYKEVLKKLLADKHIVANKIIKNQDDFDMGLIFSSVETLNIYIKNNMNSLIAIELSADNQTSIINYDSNKHKNILRKSFFSRLKSILSMHDGQGDAKILNERIVDNTSDIIQYASESDNARRANIVHKDARSAHERIEDEIREVEMIDPYYELEEADEELEEEYDGELDENGEE